jgi:hypothetical protein
MNILEESNDSRGKFLPVLVIEREIRYKSLPTIDFLVPTKNPIFGGKSREFKSSALRSLGIGIPRL